MRIKNPKIAYLEAQLDIPTILRSYFPEYGEGSELVFCPKHDDTKPSLYLYADGSAKCFGCDFWARDIADLCATLDGMSYDEAIDTLYAEAVNAVPEAIVQSCRRLMSNKVLDYLKVRFIGPQMVERFDLGYEPTTRRITIPIRDQFGTCVNIRRMGWLGIHDGGKVLNLKGHGEIRLYPEDVLIKERRVVLVEGEWDCLAGRAIGLPTVTWTGGAGGWNHKYDHLFANKAVWILYDSDKAGIAGALNAATYLSEVTRLFSVCKPLSKKGKDLTDWIGCDYREVVAFKSRVVGYKFSTRTVQKKFCATCGQEIRK